jgi:hypothetical protein
MRGEERRQRTMLMAVNVEERISQEHPLRRIKHLADASLKELSPISTRCTVRSDGRRFRPSGCSKPRC